VRALDHFAATAARLTHCEWQRDWVCKSRPGLANHAMARVTYANLAQVGPPRWRGEAIRLAGEIQSTLGLEPMAAPFLDDIEQLIAPEAAEGKVRAMLPPTQTHFTSDDYTDYCWQTPTVRLYIGRPALKAPPGYAGYPDWAMNALGGLAATIDPMVDCAGKTIAGTIIDLMTDPRHLAAAKAEFETRTGGGIGGKHWIAPLCDYPAPIHYRWPEYVTTPRGRREWVIPTGA
jgi:aminobenzoyl-glutamate utilization protein B